MSCRAQQARQRVAKRRTATVSHMKRTGRIGGHVFKQNFFGVLDDPRTIALPLFKNICDDVDQRLFRQKEIDESGAGDFGRGDKGNRW